MIASADFSYNPQIFGIIHRMVKTLWEKMFIKANYSVVILHVPSELKDLLEVTKYNDKSLTGKYNFILAFFSKKANLQQEIIGIKESLIDNGLLWIAYPKDKALQTDLDRDILREFMRKYLLDSISIISLSNTWSAIRFKKV